MAEVVGFEPTRALHPTVFQTDDLPLVYTSLNLLVGPEGVEPSTPCLRGRYSNLLSYGPIMLYPLYQPSTLVEILPFDLFLHTTYFCLSQSIQIEHLH